MQKEQRKTAATPHHQARLPLLRPLPLLLFRLSDRTRLSHAPTALLRSSSTVKIKTRRYLSTTGVRALITFSYAAALPPSPYMYPRRHTRDRPCPAVAAAGPRCETAELGRRAVSAAQFLAQGGPHTRTNRCPRRSHSRPPRPAVNAPPAAATSKAAAAPARPAASAPAAPTLSSPPPFCFLVMCVSARCCG